MTSVIQTHTHDPDLTDAASAQSRPTLPPDKTPFLRGARKWRNRVIVLIMVAVAGLGAYQIVQHQGARNAKLDLADVQLTSQPIPVESPQSGLVTWVAVHAGDKVASGQQLGSIAVTTTNATGHAVISQHLLVAPRSGYVVDDPLTVGATLQPGGSFVDLYDPADLRLVTSVPVSYLPRISAGMTAKLTAPGVPGVVTAVLQRVVPRVGTSEQDVPGGDLRLVFIAKDDAQVARLLPGLRFHGAIDTRTGSGHDTRAQFVNP